MGALAWVALLPWLRELSDATPRQAFWRSYWIGILFFAGTVGWLRHVTLAGTILLVIYLALYFGVWGWLAQRFIVRRSWKMFLVLPAGWVILEYVRNLLINGFGWNLLAHTQWNWLPLIQIADFTGVYGVSFLVVLGNLLLGQVVTGQKATARISISVLGAAGLCLAGVLGYGQIRLRQVDRFEAPSFKVAVVQGNIPQPEKWDEAFAEGIWKRYEQLSQTAAQGRPDLILWPETAVPGFLEDPRVAQRLSSLVRRSGTPMLVGVPTEDGDDRLFNSAVLLGAQGEPIARHDKLHLVPFGEYIPLKPIFGWLKNVVVIGDFSPGHRFTLFQASDSSGAPKAPFSVLICFEDLFPGLSRRFVKGGARWLVVITNDAWFRRSGASLQHLQASVFRAVENRVWVARAANTGWSGFIDPAGRRLTSPHQIPRFQPGVAVAEMKAGPADSLYTRWGDWFPWGCFFLLGLGIIKPGARLKPGT